MDPAYSQSYRLLHERHWWWRSRERILRDTLRRRHASRPGDRVLDVGCGDGLMFPLLLEFGAVEGIEPDRNTFAPGAEIDPRIHVQPFDETFAPEGSFGLITMLDVLEHLDDPAAAVRQAARLLRPGGTLLITVPAFPGLWTSHDVLNQHRTRYTRSTLGPLATDAGLEIRYSRYLFQWTAAAKVGVRLREAILGGRPSVPRIPPGVVNSALLGITLAESRLAERLRPPFGSSLLVMARKGE